MNAAQIAQQLAKFTGLDVETAQTQLVPFLDSFKTARELESHLIDLLSSGPQQRAFITSFVTSRFPSIPTPVPAPSPSLRPPKPQPPRNAPRLTSDLLAPKPKSKARGTPSPASPAASPPPPQQKSAELEEVEGLIRLLEVDPRSARIDDEGAREGSSAGGRGRRGWSEKGCFCQASKYPLSRLTPSCPTCHLPLCIQQHPLLPCPSCGATLLTPSQLTAHLSTLRKERDALLARETAAREVARQAAEEAARLEAANRGAFPALVSSANQRGSAVTSCGAAQQQRVLSLNMKTKQVRVQTQTRTSRPATPSASTSRTSSPPSLPVVPPPPAPTQRDASERKGRPWVDLGEENRPVYIAEERGEEGGEEGGEGDGEKKGRRARRKGKGKGKERAGAAVPGAG